MASLPFRSGSSTGTRRSKRPGRVSAGSSDSGRFVAARIITPLLPSKPSISVSSWFRVCSRSSLPPILPPSRFLPMASISSMNTMHGSLFLGLTGTDRAPLLAPMPTNISTNSEPEMEKNGTLASPATALASMVLPVPGGPTSRMPFGMEAPIIGVLLRIVQIIDDLRKALLGLVLAGHIAEMDTGRWTAHRPWRCSCRRP